MIKAPLRMALMLAGIACGAFTHADEQLTGPSAAVPADYFGMHFHRAAQSTTVPFNGIGTWRLWDAGVAWRYLADQGPTLDFRPLDKLVSLGRQRRIELLYTFGATPTWASARPRDKGPYGPGSAAEPRDIADWTDYVRRVARRYKGQIKNYEIWNEPNGGFFTGSPQSLVELGCAAARTLKEVDAGITVVSASGVGGYPNQLQWLDDYLGHDAARCVDVIGYHIYSATGTPESMLGTLRSVQALMRKHGVDKPLWNTEAGWRLDLGASNAPAIDPHWPKMDAVQSPAYVARALLIGWTAGLKRYYWYAWDHADMGFVRPDGKTTASADAYLTMERWMLGAVVNECHSAGLLWQCTLTRDGTQQLIAWTEDGASRSWPVPAGLTHAERLSGERSQVSAGEQLLLGPQPVLLTP